MKKALAIWIGCLISGLPLVAQSQDISAAQVRQSVDNGVKYLLREQQNQGGWLEIAGDRHKGGTTALCLLALLNCGVDADNPTLKKSIDKLIAIPANQLSTYVASLRIMVLSTADPRRYRAQVDADVQWLVESQVPGGDSRGGWGYLYQSGTADASNSQFALLALHDARQIGVAIPDTIWINAKAYWEDRCDPRSGGFTYSRDHRNHPYGSMTCAGIASLIIVNENLADPQSVIGTDETVRCCRGISQPEQLNRAFEWMADNFSVTTNPGFHPMTKYYHLYCLERAGRLSGRRFFGNYDWYRLGAEHLIKMQNIHTGAWQGSGMLGEANELVSTSFALLFLSKGKRPIVIGKYQHGDSSAIWDPHPNGVHYLTRQLEGYWQQKLNWQTIDGRVASADDLNEAEVLFISGTRQLDMTDDQKQALRLYIESGKLLFAEAAQGDGCGDAVEFDQKFRALIAELFPGNQLQALSPGHPVWSAQFKLDFNAERPLLGLESSCRTSVIYCPRNLTCLWELNQPGWIDAFPERARQQVDYATKLGVNVIAYATGRELKDKLDKTPLTARQADGIAGRLLEIPKLAHAGGADDAPNAWRNVIQRLRFDMQMPVSDRTILVNPQLDQLTRYPLLFMHGRQEFQWSEDEREAIRTYLNQGGFIFCDSICASRAFVESFRREMRGLYDGRDLESIGADHPMWSEQFMGYDLRNVTLRIPDVRPDGTSTHIDRQTHPLMEMLRLPSERIAVVFSPYDLSCALENAAASQCSGYKKDDAAKIGVNVILYALQQQESSATATVE